MAGYPKPCGRKSTSGWINMAKTPRQPEQVEVEDFKGSPPAANTAVGAFTDIVVNVPSSITVRMVNASALEDYEIWVFISSLLSNAVVGFLIAYFQALDGNSPSKGFAGWTTVVFSILFFVSVSVAIRKRMQLREKGKNIKLRTSAARFED